MAWLPVAPGKPLGAGNRRTFRQLSIQASVLSQHWQGPIGKVPHWEDVLPSRGLAGAASELSLGVYQHDIDDTFSFGNTEHGKQIVIGARTAALDELAFIWRPRVHVIAGFNTAGGTD